MASLVLAAVGFLAVTHVWKLFDGAVDSGQGAS